MYVSIAKMMDQNQKRLECEIENQKISTDGIEGLFEVYTNHSPFKIIPL